MMLLIK